VWENKWCIASRRRGITYIKWNKGRLTGLVTSCVETTLLKKQLKEWSVEWQRWGEEDEECISNYLKLETEARDRTLWRTDLRRVCWTVVRQKVASQLSWYWQCCVNVLQSSLINSVDLRSKNTSVTSLFVQSTVLFHKLYLYLTIFKFSPTIRTVYSTISTIIWKVALPVSDAKFFHLSVLSYKVYVIYITKSKFSFQQQ